MQASIHDREALKAVSPAALAAYARSAGWQRGETYRVHSHVYAGPDRPEIIVPRTDHLGDYATVVSRLIEVFAQVADQDELTIYRSLVTGDRDVVRIRVADSDDGSLGLNEGVDLVSGARDLIRSAACSLSKTQPVYRAGAIQEARELLEQVRLGQTHQGSFVITVLTPVVPPLVQPLRQELFPELSDDIPRGDEDRDAPIQRKMTRRLVEALKAARESTERAAAGESDAFSRVVEKGVSANLCEALTCLIGPFSTLDIGVSWAQTRPSPLSEAPVQFGSRDSPILQEAARRFRDRAPREEVHLPGFVERLKRPETKDDGTIHLRAHIDGQQQAVTFLQEIEGNVPSHVDSHLMSIDNYCIHQRSKGKEWLGQRPRFHLHLTPTYGSGSSKWNAAAAAGARTPWTVVPAPALESSPARSTTLWSPATPKPVPLSGWPPIQPGQDPTPLYFLYFLQDPALEGRGYVLEMVEVGSKA